MKTDDEIREELAHGPNVHRFPGAKVPPPMAAKSMADLAGKSFPVMRYDVEGWIPKGKAVLLAGKGGSGKTTLACQIGAARAIGSPFLGLHAEPGTTLALLCEDDDDDAHRMLVRYVEHFAEPIGNYRAFHYLPRAGMENTLVARSNKGGIHTTPLYGQYQQMIGDLKVSQQIIDNCRHVACINENDGAEVTAAWSLIHGLMQPSGGTTILIGHTPKNGTAEFSGNAAWENVARCRLFLGPATADPDAEPVENDPRRVLRRGKSNANGTAELALIWERGVFRLANPDIATYGDKLAADMRRGQACQTFLDALDELTSQQRSTSAGECTRNYAPKVMVAAGLADGFTTKELEAAMNALFKEGRIKAGQPLGWRGSDRHPVCGIARS